VPSQYVGELPSDTLKTTCSPQVARLSLGRRQMTELQEDATQCGISMASVRRAQSELGIVKERRDATGKRGAFGKGSKVWWRLPDTRGLWSRG
jgi:hypothetical protein